MILNLSKIKTEALLLFCKDLILSYHNSQEKLFDVDNDINAYIENITEDFLKNIELRTFPSEHYLQNAKHYRIKAILNAYNLINSEVSKYLQEGKAFNPAMLYFSMLAVWFKELNKESKSKEYIFFLLYPYANVYDKLLLNIKDENFKHLNIQMIEIAERVIFALEKKSFK